MKTAPLVLALTLLAPLTLAAPPRGASPADAGVPAWPAVMLNPDKVIAHRVRLHHSNPFAPKTLDGGTPVTTVDGWVSIEARTLLPGSPELARVTALLKSGNVSDRRLPPMLCGFNGDFGLQWFRGTEQREAVFCFSCTQVGGNAGLHSFSGKAVGALASGLFPDDPRLKTAAAGGDLY